MRRITAQLVFMATLGTVGTLACSWHARPAAAAKASQARDGHAAGRAADTCIGGDALGLLRAYFGLDPADGADALEAMARHAAALRYRIDFLVGSVPSPSLPSMGFDTSVTAMTRALESGGFTMDRYRYPWHSSASAAPAVPACEGAPGVVLFRHLPAPNSPLEHRRLLVLFLVTETPTAGVDKRALHESLRQVRDLLTVKRSLDDEQPDPTVRFIGPSFSGSAESLAIAIRTEPGLNFSMLSGTVTSGGAKPILEAVSSPEHQVTYFGTVVPDEVMAAAFYRYLVGHMGASTHDIAVLTESSTSYGQGLIGDIRRCELMALRCDLERAECGVKADLCKRTPQGCGLESAPACDAGLKLCKDRVRECQTSKTSADDAVPPEPAEQPKAANDTRAQQQMFGPRLVLPFPLHIARLRSAWEKQEQHEKQAQQQQQEHLLSGAEGEGAPEGAAEAPELGDSAARALPRSSDSVDRNDILPILSRKTLDQEDLALQHILATISSEQIRYVGLLATDSEDKRFLAQQIRRFCPDVVLFTFESDILFAHPDDADNLKGMLVVSTYPLNTKNQGWTFPFQGREQRMQFTDRSQGIFNAAAIFLNQPENLLEYAPPFIHDDRRIRQGFRPPLWISAVGQDAIVPLEALSSYADDQHYVFLPMSDGPALHLGTKWQGNLDGLFTEFHARKPSRHYEPFRLGASNVAAILIGLLCLLNCVGYFRLFHHGSAERSYPWRFLDVFRRVGTAKSPVPIGERGWQLLYLLLCFMLQLGLYAYMGWLYFTQFHIDRPGYYQNLKHTSWYLTRHGWGQDTIFDRAVDTWALGLFISLCIFTLLITVIDIVWVLLSKGQLRGVPGGAWLRALFHRKSLVGDAATWIARRVRRQAAKDPPPSLLAPALGLLLLLLGSALTYVVLLAAINARALSGETPNTGLILLFRRAAHLEYGLSPALPLSLMCAIMYLWCYTALKRIRLLSEMERLPVPGIPGGDIREQDRAIKQALRSVMPGGYYVLSALAAVVALDFFVGRLATLEGWAMTALFRGLIFLAIVGVLLSLVRFISVARHFHWLLFSLAHQPIIDAFDRLPARFALPLGMQFLSDVPTQTRQEAVKEHWRLLCNHFRRFYKGGGTAAGPAAQATQPTLPPREGAQEGAEQPAGGGPAITTDDFLVEQRVALDRFAAIAALTAPEPTESIAVGPESLPLGATDAVLGLLDLYWRERPLSRFFPEGLPEARDPGLAHVSTATLYTRALPDTVHMWLRLAEDFVAIQLVGYINQVFPQLRNLLVFITSTVLLLICALSMYPFQPHRFLMFLCGLLIFMSAGTGLAVFIQMNRDEALSRIAKTEPGEVTWDRPFLSQIVVYVAVPLIGFIAAQFPVFGGLVSSALGSLLRTLK